MKNLRHHIDLNAPGGLAQLFAANRALFGDATMRTNPDADPQPNPDPTPNPDPQSTSTTNDEKLGEPGLRALQAERDARAAAERELAAFREDKAARDREALTETERAKADALAASTRAAELETENARLRAIAKYGVPEDLQDMVAGKDQASLEASAKRLSDLATKAAGGKVTPDPITEQGGGDKSKDKSGGSLQAGRDLYDQKHSTAKKG